MVQEFRPCTRDPRKVNTVFEIFRHREWEREIVPEVRGTNGRLEIVINDLPCLRDRANGARKFAFHDFGTELLKSLCADQFSDIEHVRRVLSIGEKLVYVHVRDLQPVVVHLTGQVALDPERFFSDLADCLARAFRAEHILH